MSFKSTPSTTAKMPKGIPYIIGNEAAERFSFYGMKAALTIFLIHYLHLMNDKPTDPMSDAQANTWTHGFVTAAYLTPLIGAIISDRFLGKYKTIITLSIVYCLGHFTLAFMGIAGPAKWYLLAGLGLISIGSGGIKPCVSAHVGDQFGPNNQHLLTNTFNWFYFSINLGSVISNMLIPWVLEWYGPHWAFGIPGALMGLATLLFWMGRHTFIHIPAAGRQFTREILSKAGIATVLRLSAIFAFVAIFWSLFDQTASTWVIQAQNMDRELLGITLLPSQIQSANPFFILLLIPVFSYLIYPAISKVFPLTPLRKMGIGLLLTTTSFATVALIQTAIDNGQAPNISWQILAYLLLTSGEIMISIVALEFAYKNSPTSMKSWIMAIFLASVAAGNFFTAAVNYFIQIPSPTAAAVETYRAQQASEPDQNTLSYKGLDNQAGTADDITLYFDAQDTLIHTQVPAARALAQAAQALTTSAGASTEHSFPDPEQAQEILADHPDPYAQDNQPLGYRLISSTKAILTSIGPDHSPQTQWDTHLHLELSPTSPQADTDPEPKKTNLLAALEPDQPWLQHRQQELGLATQASNQASAPAPPTRPEEESPEKASLTTSPSTQERLQLPAHITPRYQAGGQTTLQGASYYWFFTILILVATILFIPTSKLIKTQSSPQ